MHGTHQIKSLMEIIFMLVSLMNLTREMVLEQSTGTMEQFYMMAIGSKIVKMDLAICIGGVAQFYIAANLRIIFLMVMV